MAALWTAMDGRNEGARFDLRIRPVEIARGLRSRLSLNPRLTRSLPGSGSGRTVSVGTSHRPHSGVTEIDALRIARALGQAARCKSAIF